MHTSDSHVPIYYDSIVVSQWQSTHVHQYSFNRFPIIGAVFRTHLSLQTSTVRWIIALAVEILRVTGQGPCWWWHFTFSNTPFRIRLFQALHTIRTTNPVHRNMRMPTASRQMHKSVKESGATLKSVICRRVSSRVLFDTVFKPTSKFLNTNSFKAYPATCLRSWDVVLSPRNVKTRTNVDSHFLHSSKSIQLMVTSRLDSCKICHFLGKKAYPKPLGREGDPTPHRTNTHESVVQWHRLARTLKQAKNPQHCRKTGPTMT